MSPYATDNKRMRQILKDAGVQVAAMAPDRVVLKNIDGSIAIDPLARLILHLEPTAARGHEHMPSLDEMRAAGLIDDRPSTTTRPKADLGTMMMPGSTQDDD